MSEQLTETLFLLEPKYEERVWGGQQLQQQHPPIGEAWCANENSVVRHRLDRLTVGQLATQYNDQLLGTAVAARHPRRFPLLIKLLDCADWLSVQVHPN